MPTLVERLGLQLSSEFLGGSIGDLSVILEGVYLSKDSKTALYSTVHGAGRIMGRREAAGVDEFPHCYKRIEQVLNHHKDTIKITHYLKPIGVIMAGEGEFDPYKRINLKL